MGISEEWPTGVPLAFSKYPSHTRRLFAVGAVGPVSFVSSTAAPSLPSSPIRSPTLDSSREPPKGRKWRGQRQTHAGGEGSSWRSNGKLGSDVVLLLLRWLESMETKRFSTSKEKRIRRKEVPFFPLVILFFFVMFVGRSLCRLGLHATLC